MVRKKPFPRFKNLSKRCPGIGGKWLSHGSRLQCILGLLNAVLAPRAGSLGPWAGCLESRAGSFGPWVGRPWVGSRAPWRGLQGLARVPPWLGSLAAGPVGSPGGVHWAQRPQLTGSDLAFIVIAAPLKIRAIANNIRKN